MLEEFVSAATVQELQSCIPAPHLEAWCARLIALGYTRATIRAKVGVVSTLTRWLADEQLAIVDLDEQRIVTFLTRRRRRRNCGARATLLALLEQLRAAGVVPGAAPASGHAPRASLLAGFEEYLRQERALAASTIASYRVFVRAFIDAQLAGGAAAPCSLGPDDVRTFLLTRVRQLTPRYAQTLGTALRVFLRFLFLRGETATDLALAVPTVRQWRLARVPRHLSSREVTRLLRTCDRTTATGRRDYAVLLLLARLGLRASEVMVLELDDVRWRDGELVVRGKGGRHDRLPLPPDVGAALARYLRQDRPRAASRRLFLCRRAPYRGFANPSSISTLVMRTLARAGLTPPTRGAHLLRHSLATMMVQRGASFAEIGQVLRHRSPTATEIYAKVDVAALREVAPPWPTTTGGAV